MTTSLIRSDPVYDGTLDMAKECKPAEQQDRRGDKGRGNCGRVGGRGVAEHCPPKALDGRSERIEDEQITKSSRYHAERIDHRGRKIPELDQETDQVPDIAIER